jgi:hypothetical protein
MDDGINVSPIHFSLQKKSFIKCGPRRMPQDELDWACVLFKTSNFIEKKRKKLIVFPLVIKAE